MKKKEEKEYFNNEWQDMKAALNDYIETGEQHYLHKFRVQVKKIRAMLILADSANNKPQLQQEFKPIKRIFKKGGEIRNAHINLKLAEEYKVKADDFVLEQGKLMDDAANIFREKGESHLEKLKLSHHNIEEAIKPVSDLHINEFYLHHLNQISNLLANLHFDESLHQCRKWIKILIYNFKLTGPVLQFQLNVDYLQEVQKAIGDWHDNVLAKELFSAYELTDGALLARINRKHTKLENNVKKLVIDFYNCATTTVELMLEQVS